MNKKRIFRQIFLMIMAIALFIGVKIGIAKGREYFDSKHDGLSQELSGLPVFDRDTEFELIKTSLQISDEDYNRDCKPYKDIISDAIKTAREKTNRKFSPEYYRKKFSAEQEKLKAANYGQSVTFKYKTSSGNIKTVTGTYDSSTTTEIFVDGKIISKKRILKEYRHLFSRNLSIRLMADNSTKFKKDFARQKSTYYENLKKKLILEELQSEGYVDYDGKILTPKQITDKLLSQAEKEVKIDREELVQQLQNKYKLFDYFSYHIKFPEADNSGKDEPQTQTN